MTENLWPDHNNNRYSLAARREIHEDPETIRISIGGYNDTMTRTNSIYHTPEVALEAGTAIVKLAQEAIDARPTEGYFVRPDQGLGRHIVEYRVPDEGTVAFVARFSLRSEAQDYAEYRNEQ